MEKIARLCAAAGCPDKLRKIHFNQFVYREWHPHPPRDFIDWWARHPDNVGEGGSDPESFFNCARYYAQFREARIHGLLAEIPVTLQKPEVLALPF